MIAFAAGAVVASLAAGAARGPVQEPTPEPVPGRHYAELIDRHQRAAALDAVYTLEIFGSDADDVETLIATAHASFQLARPRKGTGRVEVAQDGERRLALELRGDGRHWNMLNSLNATYQRLADDLDDMAWTPQLELFRAWSGQPRAKPLGVAGHRLPDGTRTLTVTHHDATETYTLAADGALREAGYEFRALGVEGIVRARHHYVFERWEPLETLPGDADWKQAPPAGFEEVDANWAHTRRLVAIGDELPDLRLVFLDGRVRQLVDLRGKTVVLSFWFAGCPPCRQELPELQALASALSEREDVVFLCANPVDRPPAIEAFWRARGLDRLEPVLVLDRDVESCRVRAYPALYVVGPDGRVVHRAVGFDAETGIERLERALAPPEVAGDQAEDPSGEGG